MKQNIMHVAPRTRNKLLAAAPVSAVFAAAVFVGCHSKPKSAPGNMAPAGQAASIDASWVTAAESCWPAIRQSGRSLEDIRHYLLDPAHFRVTFPSYAVFSDDQIRSNLTLPIATIPPPEIAKLAHSQTPVLTRGQAAAGTGPQGAIVAGTNGIAPPDSLCSIQPGTPDGF